MQCEIWRPDISAPAQECVESLALISNPIHLPHILFISDLHYVAVKVIFIVKFRTLEMLDQPSELCAAGLMSAWLPTVVQCVCGCAAACRGREGRRSAAAAQTGTNRCASEGASAGLA